jgi:hypothetical protein
VSEQKLNRSQIPSGLLCSAHRVSPIDKAIKPGTHQCVDDPGILPSREVWPRSEKPGELKPLLHCLVSDTQFEHGPGLLSDFELNWSPGFFWTVVARSPGCSQPNIDFELDEIATPELAMDCQIQQRKEGLRRWRSRTRSGAAY